MSILKYIKEKIFFIILNVVMLIITYLILNGLEVDKYAIIFIIFLNFVSSILLHIYDYLNKKKFYNEVLLNLRALDKKYLISDLIEEPNFQEGKLLYEIIKETDKSMNDEIAKFKINNEEYKEYIELWVHEIKTPIASCKLVIENNPSEVTSSLEEEIDKVENYIEQALFYTKSNMVEKDYLIKQLNIKDCINSTLKKNANVLINKGIRIELKDNDKTVYSDSKWVEFIIQQILSNSIKYMDKTLGVIKIYCLEEEDNVILNIEDNGIGMNEKDQVKAFDKGYTGENGRRYGRSTGIGLYLCKTLANKLGLGIDIFSEAGKGTKIRLVFTINKLFIFGES
jgi:signal transduction histidine kinase